MTITGTQLLLLVLAGLAIYMIFKPRPQPQPMPPYVNKDGRVYTQQPDGSYANIVGGVLIGTLAASAVMMMLGSGQAHACNHHGQPADNSGGNNDSGNSAGGDSQQANAADSGGSNWDGGSSDFGGGGDFGGDFG